MTKEEIKETILSQIICRDGVVGSELINYPEIKSVMDKYPQFNVVTLLLELVDEDKILEIRYMCNHRTKSMFFSTDTKFVMKLKFKNNMEFRP